MRSLENVELYLGMLITLSKHKDATRYVIKRIDSEEEIIYIVELDGSGGHWYDGTAVYQYWS